MTKKSSIDYNELNKFYKTSNEWWEELGEFKILHNINPVRLKYITKKITDHFGICDLAKNDQNPLINLNVIDIGCGGGLISIPICKLGANVTAIDANNNHDIGEFFVRIKKNGLKINFIHATVEDYLNLNPNNLYDVVLCLEVLEHVDNQSEFIQNLLKLLKPNGILLLSTVNRTIKSYAQVIIAAEYILKWLPINTHSYSKFLKPSEIYNTIKQDNFFFKDLTGLKFNAFTGHWYLSNDISVNYFACIALSS